MRKGFFAAALAAALVAVLWIVFPRPSAVLTAEPESVEQAPSLLALPTDAAAEPAAPRAEVARESALGERASAPSTAGFLRLVDGAGKPVTNGRMAALRGATHRDEVELDPDAVWFADANGWLPTPSPELVRNRQLVVGAPGFLADWVGRLPRNRELQLEPSQPFAGHTLLHGSDRPVGQVVLELYAPMLTAEYFVHMQRVVSGPDGSFAFDAGPRGRRAELLSPQGARGRIDLSLQLVEGLESGYTLYLPPPAVARVRLVDGDSGAPLPDLAVHVDGAGDLRTDGQGEIEVSVFPGEPGSGRANLTSVEISANGRLSADAELVWDGTLNEVPLFRGVRLEVMVLGPDGEPVTEGQLLRSGASYLHKEGDPVRVMPLADFWGPLQRGAEPGLWTVPVRPGSEYNFGYDHEHYPPKGLRILIPTAQAVHRVELRLEHGASLQGVLVGASHPRGALVYATGVAPPWGSKTWTANADDRGRFSLSGLTPGEITLTAHHVDTEGTRYTLLGGSSVRTLHVGEQTVELHLVAQDEPRQLRGKVLDEGGAAVEGAYVSLYSRGPAPAARWPAASTNRNGEFTLTGLEGIELPVFITVRTHWDSFRHTFEAWPEELPIQIPRAAQMRTVAQDAVTATAIGNSALFFRKPGELAFTSASGGRQLAGGETEWDLPPGPLEVRLAAVDYALGDIESLELVPGQQTSLAQLLEPGAALSIQVENFTQPEGEAAPLLQLVPQEQRIAWEEGCEATEFHARPLGVHVDNEGRARFAAVPRGRYAVSWDREEPLTPAQIDVPRGPRELMMVRVGP